MIVPPLNDDPHETSVERLGKLMGNQGGPIIVSNKVLRMKLTATCQKLQIPNYINMRKKMCGRMASENQNREVAIELLITITVT